MKAISLTRILLLLFILQGWFQIGYAQQDLDEQVLPAQVEEATTDNSEVSGTNIPDEIPVSVLAAARGKALFNQNCNICHEVSRQKIGPALASIHNKRPLPWLYNFIRRSQHVIQVEKDEYAQHLYQEFNEYVMPNFEFLTNENITNILAYIRVESMTPTAGVSSVGNIEVESTLADPTAEDNYYSQKGNNEMNASGFSLVQIMLAAVALGLIIMIVLAALSKGSRTNA